MKREGEERASKQLAAKVAAAAAAANVNARWQTTNADGDAKEAKRAKKSKHSSMLGTWRLNGPSQMLFRTKVTPCPAFVSGGCFYGRACPMAHTLEEVYMARLPFLKMARRKAEVSFTSSSSSQESSSSSCAPRTTSQAPPASPRREPASRSASPCKDSLCDAFLKGTCERGAQCPYAHAMEELTQPEDAGRRELRLVEKSPTRSGRPRRRPSPLPAPAFPPPSAPPVLLAPPPASPAARAKALQDDVEDFLVSNPVDPDAAAQLRSLRPQHQRSVLDRGDLLKARNPSAVLIARMREAGNGVRHMHDEVGVPAPPLPAGCTVHEGIEAMISHYHLDARAANLLRGLPPSKQDIAAAVDLSQARRPSAYLMAQLTQAKLIDS
mmetsp:Transcript_66479/g.187267  ORF Transcript_66479/g.187267 Transcript_66479/m.187267 type:complete len:382 (-) Transcript_66479:84-1229(-)